MSDLVEEYKQHWRKHVDHVRYCLGVLAEAIWERGKVHDASKIEEPELSIFAANFKTLRKIQWGSSKYYEALAAVKVAKEHHHAENRHHPEHFKDGCFEMTLVDLVEMFCDWKAANARGEGPKLEDSIKICCERYGIPPMLRQIFLNTVKEYP